MDSLKDFVKAMKIVNADKSVSLVCPFTVKVKLTRSYDSSAGLLMELQELVNFDLTPENGCLKITVLGVAN
jgi:hypothetical protein